MYCRAKPVWTQAVFLFAVVELNVTFFRTFQVLYKSRDPSWCFPMPEVRVIILMATQLKSNGCLIRQQIQIYHDNEVSHSIFPTMLEEVLFKILTKEMPYGLHGNELGGDSGGIKGRFWELGGVFGGIKRRFWN